MDLEDSMSEDEIDALPEGAGLRLGCGAPIAQLALCARETVLDLGSGAGLDAILAAREVGPQGSVIGVDMTPEMIERARANARKAGATQVEFREGRLEALPVDGASVDAVTSNCLINLVPDKGRVFAEIARVLKPDGRLVLSDIVLDGRLPERVEKDVDAYVGRISGAAARDQYFGQVREAGLGEVEILKDVDYLAGLRTSAPQEADALLERSGVRWEDLAGKVRAITFRARRAD
jgi:SAM-dependent methyltransferase